MTEHDPMVEMIQQADRAVGSQSGHVDVRRIYQRDQRQRQLNAGIGLVVSVVVGLSIGIFVLRKPGTPQIEVMSSAELESQTQAVLAKAEFLEQMDQEVEQALSEAKVLADLKEQMPTKDPVDEFQENMNEVVKTMLVQAQLFERTPGLRRKAIQEYQKVTELFPDNTWARVARQRLLAMKQRRHL